ncbi:MAG: htpG [Gammaproteobacteria bacterium]|jgi:molecular chaperone HtpG|nr:htpG [Gammaproteobacteria bacterium]
MTAAAATQKQTCGFQAEVGQVLHLVTHSLYSNREIFLRELISNASDALDKLRFMAVSEPSYLESDTELGIHIEIDKDAKTLTIRDNGIGMDRDEIIAHLGTIAKSGTKEFLKVLSAQQSKESLLIGQFGVGFYSSFIVADKVTVRSRKAGLVAETGVEWESTGESDFSVETITKTTRGTEVILHLKEDAAEFLDNWRIKSLIHKYSDHISFPIWMQKEAMPQSDEEKDENISDAVVFETVNRAQALWTLPKSKVTDQEYIEFYKHISHDFSDPLAWAHNKVEGKLEYTSLLYIPKNPPFDLYQRDVGRGLKLYVKRVFIMDDAEQLLPMYLRFVKGVIDSNDLPLNVSRELLQNNEVIESLRAATARRILDLLEKMAKEEADKYAEFWKAFGPVLKEGIAEDFANKDKIASLLRFETTRSDGKTDVSLADYIARMKDKQDKIYYVTADSAAAARHSPQLEIFKQKDIEVLLLSDRVDEWLVVHLSEFEGKTLQSIAKGALDLDTFANEEEKKAHEQVAAELKPLAEAVKEALGDAVKEVRISHRLTDSPACVVADENDLGGHVQRLLKAAGQAMPESKPILELNPNHPIVKQLDQNKGTAQFKQWSQVLLSQAILADGAPLADPATFVSQLNELWKDLLGR